MKTIMVFTIPAYGHINPMLAMIKLLKDNGYRVCVYSTMRFKELILSTGSEFISYSIDESSIDLHDGSRLLRFQRTLLSFTWELLDNLIYEVGRIGPSLIIHDSAAHWGLRAAQLQKIPVISFCSYVAVNRLFSKSFFAYFKNFSIKFFFDLNSIPYIQRYKHLLNKKYGFKRFSILDVCYSHENLHILSYSKFLQPGYKGFSNEYFFLGPSSILYHYTDSKYIINTEVFPKKNIVYVSLGTIFNQNKHFYKKLFRELSNTKYKVYISDGSNVAANIKRIPSNFVIREYFVQEEMLRHADVFITAGGMNSIGEAIFYHTPCLIYPQQGEQKINCESICRLGFGKRYQVLKPVLGQLEQVMELKSSLNSQIGRETVEVRMDVLLRKIEGYLERK